MATEILKKPYARIVIPDTDGSFVAEIAEFPGCMAVGDTPAEALENLEEVAADWIAAAREQGQEIPEPMETTGYSGKLVLRMPKSLHQRAALFAERDGVSLNQFIVTCLAETVGTRSRPKASMNMLTVHNFIHLPASIPQLPQSAYPGIPQALSTVSSRMVFLDHSLELKAVTHA